MRAAALVLLALLALLAPLVSPPAAVAQAPARVARVGVLVFSTPATDPTVPVFRNALRELGWSEGRNLTLEYRFADGRADRLPDQAAALAALKPDLIYAVGGDVAPFVKRATSTIPIVVAVSNDPVDAGLIPSLAAGATLAVRIVSMPVRRPDDFDGAFQSALREHVDALIVVSSRLMAPERTRILDFATRRRLPMATGWGEWAEGGALLTYGPNISEIVRRSASYVDRILRGTRPADLPFERPTRFELVVNRRVAETLGLTLPPSLLLRADRVIE